MPELERLIGEAVALDPSPVVRELCLDYWKLGLAAGEAAGAERCLALVTELTENVAHANAKRGAAA